MILSALIKYYVNNASYLFQILSILIFSYRMSDKFSDMDLSGRLFTILKDEFEKEPLFVEEFLASALKALISLRDDLKGRIPLPDQAPVTYLKRDKYQYDFGCDPIAFMDHYYGRFIKAKVMYQDQLHALDPTLAMSIHSHCYRMKRDYPERAHEFNALDYLPPSRERRTEWLAQISDALLELKTKEVIAARNSMRSRKCSAKAE